MDLTIPSRYSVIQNAQNTAKIIAALIARLTTKSNICIPTYNNINAIMTAAINSGLIGNIILYFKLRVYNSC